MILDCARYAVLAFTCLTLGVLPAHAGDCEPEWLPLGSGTNSEIRAMQVFDDGSGPALYAGGFFTQASGSNPASRRIARWDGSSWSPLGSGMTGATFTINVSALTVFDDGSGPALYAAGEFTEAGGNQASNIARWDGSSWSPLGLGTNGQVSALTVYDDGSGPALYAGGEFTEAGGNQANHIARWDGSSWSALGSGLDANFSPLVNALAVYDDGSGPSLYAGGNFTQAGGSSANFVARWDGSSWSAVGSGTSGTVNSLTVYDDGTGPALYAGGFFSGAGGNSANRIARWDGSSWSALGSGMSGGTLTRVFSLAVFDDGSGSPALYAGGDFTQAGGSQANNIARWDGSSWSPLGSGTDNWVWEMAMFDSGTGPALYAGGSFSQAGGNPANFFASWGRPCFPGPSIASQPSSVLLPPIGGLASLSVEATGAGLIYQWFRDGQPLADSSMIIGSNSAQLTVSSQGPSMTGLYSCRITDVSGISIMSDQAIVAARPSCPGDTNGDGVVDLADLNTILSQFGNVCP